MGKDVKKRFTVSLDIETKDVEKQVKATVGNLKTILADLGKASDKMGYFKELVDYIGQIDTALTSLRAKNKDAFDHMFDGLDADLKKVMESIFDTSGKSMSALDNLRNRLNDASKNGAGVKELRQIAAEINDLFVSLGRAEPIDIDAQFSGRGKTEDRIKLLTDALDNFATVWDGVHNKVKNGFGFEGTGGVVEFSEKVQKEIDALEDKIKAIQDLMTELQNVFKMTKAFSDGKDVSLGFEATEESAKNLLDQFKLLSATRQKFLEDGDTSSPAYYENLIQYTKAATQLVALNDELAKSSKGSPKFLANALSGEFVDVYDFIESFDKKFVSSIQISLSKIISDAQTGIDKIKADALKNIPKNAGQGAGTFYGSGNTADDEMTKNKALAGSYEELSNKINEYYDILQRRKKFDEDSEEFTDLSFKLDGIADYIEKIKSLSLEEKLELNDIFGDLTYEEYGPEEALKRICNILQVEIPSAAKTAKKSLDGFGESVDGGTGVSSGGSGGTITNVDFTSLENTIKAEIASIANKLDSVFKVEVVKNDTEDIKNAIDGVKSTIEKISAEIDGYNTLKKTNAQQAEVNAMKNNLTQLFKFVSEFNAKQIDGNYQHQEISAAILSDGSISTGYGEHGTVPWDRMASALVSNLTKSLMVDIHSHPWAQNGFLDRYANDSFSGSKGDLGAFRFSKELGAQMAAMITGNVMRTLDISKLTDEQMRQFGKALAQIEKTQANTPEYSKYMEYKNDKLYYHSQPTLDEQHKVTEAFESLMYKAFKEIGLSKNKVDKEIFKKYDLTDDAQLTELAERLVYLSQSSQNALSPVERLSEIISHFSGDVNSKTAKENFEAFTKGELTAAEVFNNLNRDGHTLNQATLDSLYKIDSANEIPAVESLLTQVVSVLNTIESSVANINNNTRQSTSDQFDTALNDILDIREGVVNKNILTGIKSIFDPLNISEYKNKEVLQIADGSILDAKDYIQDLFVQSHSDGSVNLDEMQVALDKFYLAMSNIQDAIKQVDLYEERTGKTYVDSDGDIAKLTLNDKYKEITDDNLLQQLLYLLSQAKVDISKSKEFYQNGFGDKQTDYDYDNSQVSSILQSIQSTLDSIYGVLHGFTGIEADNKNALKYKEPAIDTGVNRKDFSEQDLSVLNSILQVLQSVDGYLSTNKSDDTAEKVVQDNTDTSDLVNFIKSKLSHQIATEDTLQAIKGAVEQVAELVKSKDENKKDDSEDVTQNLSTLISALTANVTTLKDVANGIVQHQKAQKSDTIKAMARIQDPKQNQIVSGLAKDAVKTLGAEVEIESLQALANGVVKVEGAFKNANDQWEGFTVKINEHNEAVDLAVKKHSALANTLNRAKDIDENTYQYSKEEVEKRAQKHLEEYAAQGKNATVQFKDSGRYTITILEEIDGLSKQIFQTFDENDKKIERTTVTMSNSQKLKLDNLQKKLIENGLTNDLISDKDGVYNDYQKALDALNNMTDTYSKLDNVSDSQVAQWKQQIALVQQLGGQVEALVKQRKLANDQKVFESDRDKKLSKFDLDKATLQKDIAIPDTFNQRMDDARTAIKNATDNDSLKIAINNWEALQNEIKKTATEQDLYFKKTTKVKNTNIKPDQFTKDLNKQKTDFSQYKTDAQKALGITDELKNKLSQLELELSNISDADGLNGWIQSFKNLKTEISNAQKGFKASQIAISSGIAGKANSKFKELNFKATDNNLTQEQEDIVNKRQELIQKIKEYNIAVNSGQKVEIDGIQKTRDELYQLIDAYKTAHNLASNNTRTNKGQAYGLNQLQTFTARYNSLLSGASDVGLDNQAPVVLNLVNAYKQLQAAQSAFVAGEDKTSAVYAKKVEVFKAAQLACNNYARELNRVVTSSKKLEADSVASDALNEDFKDTIDGRKAALKDFVQTTYGSKAVVGEFTNQFNELNFVVKNGDGTFTRMTASINEARTAIHATAGATGEVTNKFKSFINELSGKFKSISTYFMASFGIEEVWQQLRQGIQYVKEIDSALTELKKVTNETDASYDAFLQSMSKTGSVIGATVQDLTTMAADWARLGYSMQEAGKLAESTAILLNVSEFDDATAASEALISTMQAFQYTADDSQHVVDILNEVGNNYAVSSDGIATALQDSASALMEAGNNLEQSVALVAAANKVVQDPNSVGSALRTISLRLRGTSVSVLEEMGEETDGVVESVSKMQEKIQALTGVNILTDSGAYKETYEILREIGTVWEDMSDIDQAALLELMAGKNRANTLAAILGNMEDLEGAYESALNAEGSALKENEAYLDSIQGRIDLFTNSLQTMWMNFIDSSVVKFIVDIGTALIKAADAMGVLSTAAGGFVGIKAIINSVKSDLQSLNDTGTFKGNFFEKFTKDADATKVATEEVQKSLEKQSQAIEDNIDVTTDAADASTKHGAAKAAEKAMVDSSTVATGVESGVKEVNTQKTWAQVAAEKALAVAKGLVKGLLIGAAVSLATTALTSAISAISDASKRMDELTDSAIKSAEETEEAQESISDYKDEIVDLRTELDSNTLSETEAYDARQRLIEIQNELIDKFGLEAEGLNLVTGAINDQANALDKLSQKSASDWMKENMEAYKDAKSEMAKTYDSKKEILLFGQQDHYTAGMSGTLAGASKDVISAYQDGLKKIIEDEYGGTLSQEISASVDDLGNTISFDNIYASFEGKTVEELDKIFDAIQTYLLDFDNNYDNIDLSSEIIRIQNLRNKYVNSDYKEARELYNSGRQQEAIASYAEEYGAILDAEEKIYNAKNDEEKLKALKEYRAALESAKNVRTDDAHMDNYFDEIGEKFDEQEFELKVKLDEDGLKSNIEEIINNGGENGLSVLDDVAIQDMINRGLNVEGATDSSGKYTKEQISGLIALQAEADKAGIEIGSLITILTTLGLVAGKPIEQSAESVKAVSETYSTLLESINGYKEVLAQTSEIVTDNTEVTQEYKDSLKSLGLSEEELADCFDENNKLIVKNASLLNKLVKQKKQDKTATVQQAKAYSQLQYKNTISQIGQLVNKMADEIKATGNVSAATLKNINVLRQQLTTIKQTIQQYALLELSLSDAAQAYSDFEAAKQRDAQLTYGDSMVEMLGVINEGFKTGKVGSEAFQAAVKALVPESVYKDIDDLQDRMQAIYDYVDKNPIFADYFTIDEGQISITMDNIKAFVQDGLSGVEGRAPAFIGTLEDFDLSNSIKSVEDLAAAFGITEAAALAMLTEFEKYDASWGNILTRLTTTELDRNIEDTATALEKAIDAQEKFIRDGNQLYDEHGNNTAEYQKIVDGVTKAYNDLGAATKAAADNAQAYTQVEAILQGMTGELKLSQEQADNLARSLGLIGEGQSITIENGAIKLTQEQLDILNAKLATISENPTTLDIQLASDTIDQQIQELTKKLKGEAYDEKVLVGIEAEGEEEIQQTINELTATQDVIKLVYDITPSGEQNDSNLEKLGNWEANGVNITVRADTTEFDADIAAVNAAETPEKKVPITTTAAEANAEIDTVTNNNPPDKNVNIAMQGVSTAMSEVNSLRSVLASLSGVSYHTVVIRYSNQNSGVYNADGNFHISGGAFASGTVGAPQTETSLVGELGPELIVDPSTGRWHTVGDYGAEFTQVKRGQIIFNHLQTKQLLENGYVTSRGRLQGGNSAFASGTAYGFGIIDPIGGIGGGGNSGGGNSGGGDSGYEGNDNDVADDIADDAEQLVDFIEMKLEEIEAIIEKTTTRIGNFLDDTTDIKSKDELYDELVKAEKDKSETYLKAAQKYNVEAAAALSGVPQQYQEMARNGAIAIKDFIGEDQVEIAEKIEKYRELAAKADEAENGHLAAIAAISEHRVEQLEDIASDFENIISISQSHSDILQAEMDLIEESGNRLSESYYEELKKNSQKQLDDMQAERAALQKILDDSVAAGDVIVGSDDWYSMLETIYEVDQEIIDCKISLEEFQNAINDLYWDNFDKLIDEIDNVNSELSNLYDLVSDTDNIVDNTGNWTDDGITALGLLAQQMENAQFKSQQYGEAIAQLKKDYADGLYSTDEYNEKLAELTDGQHDAIKSYEDAKDAIVDLNKARIDAVKDGMQKEIDAYSELIEKKKESLNSDKEAYDFQKQIQQSNKNIEDIERKIAALEGNTSSSAMAQKKRLEAELLKAREELNDLYYDHSVEKQQEALDKELESYTENKQKEMDALDEYLKNEEQVVADSFDLIAKNAETVANTLTRISEEYGVTISDTIATPWINGANAIGTYEEQLNTSVSTTTANLEALKQHLEELQIQADKTAESVVAATRSTVVDTNDGHQTSIKGYAKGSKGVEYDQWAIIEELGDELQLVPNKSGRLDYIKKGTGILNNTLTERLIDLAMDPTSMLENSRPVIGTPGITTTNNTITIDASVGTLLNVEHLDGSNPAEVTKLVDKAWEKKMQTLNNSIKKFTR